MLANQAHLFDIPQDIHYLNAAYMSPQLRAVTAAGHAAVDRKAQPWKIGKEHFFDTGRSIRSLFAQLVQVEDPDSIALLPSASYGLASVARNIRLEATAEILLLPEQFPSNVYTWQRWAEESGAKIVFAEAAPDQALQEAVIDAINPRTQVLAVPHCHWADGRLLDLQALRRVCDEVGAYLIVDGTQSVGALPFSVKEIQPDALICAAYKWLMGPYSLALGYFGPAFSDGVPLEENWINRYGSEDFGGLVNYEPKYQKGAARFSVGEQSNFVLLPMLEAALRQLLEWQPARVQAYCRALLQDILPALEACGCRIAAEEQRAHHLFGIRMPEHADWQALQQQFREQQVFLSRRGAALRISPHVYNDEADVRALLRCFQALALS